MCHLSSSEYFLSLPAAVMLLLAPLEKKFHTSRLSYYYFCLEKFCTSAAGVVCLRFGLW